MRAVHDRHVEGLFPKSVWIRVLSEAGYEVGLIPGAAGECEILLCRRKAP